MVTACHTILSWINVLYLHQEAMCDKVICYVIIKSFGWGVIPEVGWGVGLIRNNLEGSRRLNCYVRPISCHDSVTMSCHGGITYPQTSYTLGDLGIYLTYSSKKREQLERLRSENTSCRPMITNTIDSLRSQVKIKTRLNLHIKNCQILTRHTLWSCLT